MGVNTSAMHDHVIKNPHCVSHGMPPLKELHATMYGHVQEWLISMGRPHDETNTCTQIHGASQLPKVSGIQYNVTDWAFFDIDKTTIQEYMLRTHIDWCSTPICPLSVLSSRCMF